MKKLLLTLAALIGLGTAANAETASITFSEKYSANTVVDGTAISINDDVTVTFAKNTGSTAPQYYTTGTALRMYAGNTMTVASSQNITKIEITFGTGDGTNAITAEPGTFTSPTWTGSANSVVFTEAGSSGNRRIAGITVTYGEGGTTDPDPDPTPGPGTGDANEATFDFVNNSYGLPNDQNTYVTIPTTINEGLVEITLNGSTNAWRYWSDGLREYRNNNPYLTITANGGTITEVTWTNNSGVVISETSKGTSITSWSGNAESVTLYADGSSGNAAIKTITVKYSGGEAPSVAAPKISCENNMVTITAADGATIYYTTDGNAPTNASTKYTTPFAITENTTVKAIAYVGTDASPVTTFTAVYEGNYPGFEALVKAGVNAEGTVDGPITAVYQNGQYLYVVDNLSYPMLVFGNVNKTLNNGDKIASVKAKYSPYNGLAEMTNPVLGDVTTGGATVDPTVITLSQFASTTLNTYVQIKNVTLTSATAMKDATGEGVIYSRFTGVTIPTDYSKTYTVTGFVSVYNGTYQIYPTEFAETVVDENQVATPVISPNGGAVDAGTAVNITCETKGAEIYYTTDGTEPTEDSELYDGAIIVNEAMTIKAIAIAADMTNSEVATATFTINDPNATDAMFNFTDPESLGVEKAANGAGTSVAGMTFKVNEATIQISDAHTNNPPRLWTASGNSAGQVNLRFYTGDYLDISVPTESYHITSIEFTKTGGNFAIEPSYGTFKTDGNSATWTPTAAAGVAPLAETLVSEVVFTATAGTYIDTITVNYAEGSGITTAVDAIEAVDAAPVYFNLQGQKVANPDKGIYIKVAGGKATKVIL